MESYDKGIARSYVENVHRIRQCKYKLLEYLPTIDAFYSRKMTLNNDYLMFNFTGPVCSHCDTKLVFRI